MRWCVFSKPCTVITHLDTSKLSTQKTFSCCDAILETGPAVSMRNELLVAMRNLDSRRCWRCTLCQCKVRNKFLVNFWNRTVLSCIPCTYGSGRLNLQNYKKRLNILHNNNIIEPKNYFILWINSVDGPNFYGPVTLTRLCAGNLKL